MFPGLLAPLLAWGQTLTGTVVIGPALFACVGEAVEIDFFSAIAETNGGFDPLVGELFDAIADDGFAAIVLTSLAELPIFQGGGVQVIDVDISLFVAVEAVAGACALYTVLESVAGLLVDLAGLSDLHLTLPVLCPRCPFVVPSRARLNAS